MTPIRAATSVPIASALQRSSSSSLGSLLTGHAAGLSSCKPQALGAPVATGSRSGRSQPVKSTGSDVAPQVVDYPFHLIPGQSKDFPLCVDSPRDPSPVDSSSSSWVELSARGAKSGRSADKDLSGSSAVQDKIQTLERTVALLQEQLEVPKSTTPKMTAFNAIVDLIWQTLSRRSV